MAGKPPVYENTKEDFNRFAQDLDNYFIKCQERKRAMLAKTGKIVEVPNPAPQHVTGLCCYLGLQDTTLADYETRGDDANRGIYYRSAIARAKKRCEEYAVNQLFEGQKGNKADFVLMNNFNWRNKISNKHELDKDLSAVIREARERETNGTDK